MTDPADPFVCFEDGEDLTAKVEAMLAAHDTLVAELRVRDLFLESGEAVTARLGAGGRGRKKILVKCSQGHENIFEV